MGDLDATLDDDEVDTVSDDSNDSNYVQPDDEPIDSQSDGDVELLDEVLPFGAGSAAPQTILSHPLLQPSMPVYNGTNFQYVFEASIATPMGIIIRSQF